MQFSTIGTNLTSDVSAFKKIQYFSKTNPQVLYSDLSDFTLKYTKLSNLYLNFDTIINASNYGTVHQHNHLSTAYTDASPYSLLDLNSLNSYLDYNYNISSKLNTTNALDTPTKTNSRNLGTGISTLSTDLNTKLKSKILSTSYSPFKSTLNGSENDGTQLLNPIKSLAISSLNKKFIIDTNWESQHYNTSTLLLPSPQLQFTTTLLNKNIPFRFNDLKSSDTALLTSERNTRLINSMQPGLLIRNFDEYDNLTTSTLEGLGINSLQSRGLTLFNNAARL